MIKTLYGLDKKDGIKVWTIETNDQGLLTIVHGKVGGKSQTKSEHVLQKNIGKANETSLGEQAENEALGRIKKQLDKGYREDVNDLESIPVLPMLASDYNKVGHRISFPCLGSDKLDGVRCMAKMVDGTLSIESRTGQPYYLPHIEAELYLFMKDGEILDGEVYLHGYQLQEITSAVKRTDTQSEVDKAQRAYDKTPTRENNSELEEARVIHYIRPELEFIVFDYADNTLEFSDRVGMVKELGEFLMPESKIKALNYYTVEDDNQLRNTIHPEAIARGYEGVMLRNLTGVYESGKRSGDLQKFKTFMDSEFEVVDVVPDKDGGAIFVVQNTFADNTFNVVGGSHAQRKAWIENKEDLIGKLITVKYQTLYKDTLKPQFPTFVAFRDYE